MATEMLHTYMQDHHAGAAAGVDLFRRVAEDHEDPKIREVVSRIGDETVEDLTSLEELMTLAGTPRSPPPDPPAQTVGQLKPNRRVAERSPLSDLLGREALTLAVTGKKLGFKALLDIGDPRLPRPTLENLLERAEEHGRTLEKLRLHCTDALHKE